MIANDAQRRVLVLAHTGRESARLVARACIDALTAEGISVRLLADEAAELGVNPARMGALVETSPAGTGLGADCELALVLGGDGSILRAAELTHDTTTPLLGVNLGHVGFLAEAEEDAVEATIAAIVDTLIECEWSPPVPTMSTVPAR